MPPPCLFLPPPFPLPPAREAGDAARQLPAKVQGGWCARLASGHHAYLSWWRRSPPRRREAPLRRRFPLVPRRRAARQPAGWRQRQRRSRQRQRRSCHLPACPLLRPPRSRCHACSCLRRFPCLLPGKRATRRVSCRPRCKVAGVRGWQAATMLTFLGGAALLLGGGRLDCSSMSVATWREAE